jgi:thioredoxin 1
MKPYAKMGIVVALIVAVGAIVIVKNGGIPSCCSPSVLFEQPPQSVSQPATAETPPTKADDKTSAPLPRLVDLGAGKCIPCKMMAPILKELKEQYKGRLDVVFIDVWEKPAEAKKYRIDIIPTQIFYDASGKELFRHEGFFSKEEILSKWKELGVMFPG